MTKLFLKSIINMIKRKSGSRKKFATSKNFRKLFREGLNEGLKEIFMKILLAEACNLKFLYKI